VAQERRQADAALQVPELLRGTGTFRCHAAVHPRLAPRMVTDITIARRLLLTCPLSSQKPCDQKKNCSRPFRQAVQRRRFVVHSGTHKVCTPAWSQLLLLPGACFSRARSLLRSRAIRKKAAQGCFGRLCSAADSLSIMRRTTSPRDFVLSQDLPRPCPGATQADLLLLLSWACGLQLAMAPSAPAVVLRSLPAR
jgi:hypothetical protein